MAFFLQDVYTRQIVVHTSGSAEKQKIIIFFVVAGKIGSFRALETNAVGTIDVMPVHAADIFSTVPEAI